MSPQWLPSLFAVLLTWPAAPAPNETPIPIPFIDLCRCTARGFERTAGGGVAGVTITKDVTDEGTTGVFRDTCASAARVDIEWHAEPNAVVGWEYALASWDFGFPLPLNFVSAGPGKKGVTYGNGAALSIGQKTFALRALGPESVRETRRQFQINYSPDSWLAGPDLSSPSLLTKPNGEKYALLVEGRLPAPVLGSLLSDDSVQVLPALRPERRTFFEIWKDTVFARQEGDTVHMNSWVLIHNGGFDSDSPYSLDVSKSGRKLPGFPGGPVLEPGPGNGSPVGTRSQMITALWPTGRQNVTAVSGVYPIFDPDDVFHSPYIGGYRPATQSGRAYLYGFSVDGHGAQDRRIGGSIPGSLHPITLVERVENGTATEYERGLRTKVLSFYVNRAPYFVTNSPLFRPLLHETFTTSQWSLRLVANDDDPFRFDVPQGGPSPILVLRRKIQVHGRDAQGNELTYIDPAIYSQETVTLTVPPNLAPGPCMIEVQLCDAEQPEVFVGSGRCVTQSFPVIYAPTTAGQAEPSAQEAVVTGPTLLFAPYPNPASQGATVQFRLAAAGNVELDLFDVSGHKVRRLKSGLLPAGEHTSPWDGADEMGRRVPSGLYLVRLRAGGVESIRKIYVTP